MDNFHVANHSVHMDLVVETSNKDPIICFGRGPYVANESF